ncbi:Transcription factor GTE1 [Heracleum sosnowskyi]|uniref:Transcription factor GTE1 n=1 Tax=Heracleum sosnowskyi TaxID=360622 RepID=A0AAD8GWW8_9APIA|nr:Transcription factor GTE1 [Heracleum sosnowskyi]
MVDASVVGIGISKEGKMKGNIVKVDEHRHRVDELQLQVDKIEKRVNEVQKFYCTTSKNQLKDRDKEKHIPGMKRQQQDASRRDAAAAKRMQELMRQFGTIFRQVTQHKWAWPFMHPVDVKGLGLHDYYEVIDRPMDFSTIKNQMDAKDGAGYKHVREIYADMLLVFNNAMKYNDETSEVHSMAKALLEKFEEKWLQLLPKVIEEDKRREEEKAGSQLKRQLAQEAARAELARDLTNELNEANKQLEELGGILGKKCRKISIKEKRGIGISLTQLCPEDLAKALEIVSQDNPTFQATGEEVELDISAQSEFTLWRLKFFLRDALGSQRKSSSNGCKNTTKSCDAAVPTTSAIASKRKRDICNALAKTAKKRGKKLCS